jgi:alkylated DNA nucleotide flippase Atl1
MNATYNRIYDTVRRIPKGRVATYGQIASAGAVSLVAYRGGSSFK